MNDSRTDILPVKYIQGKDLSGTRTNIKAMNSCCCWSFGVASEGAGSLLWGNVRFLLFNLLRRQRGKGTSKADFAYQPELVRNKEAKEPL